MPPHIIYICAQTSRRGGVVLEVKRPLGKLSISGRFQLHVQKALQKHGPINSSYSHRSKLGLVIKYLTTPSWVCVCVGGDTLQSPWQFTWDKVRNIRDIHIRWIAPWYLHLISLSMIHSISKNIFIPESQIWWTETDKGVSLLDKEVFFIR